MSAVAKRTKNEDDTSMTRKRLIGICRKKGLYETPEYNDSLYLNYEGFSSITNLEPYVNIKSLFLEGNIITKIENISHLKSLRGLYLQNNLIKTISNLDGLNEINTLDLSNNQIKKLENISHLKNLETLNLENNLISNTDDLREIVNNESIITLNLSGNNIKTEQDGMALMKLLGDLPNLKSLYLKGNKFLNEMNFYRKYTISTIRSLTFLDDRPVFENERRLNDAWIRGGAVAEDKEKKLIKMEKIEKRNLTRKLRREKYEARRNAMFARIEREQKENEMKEQEMQQNQDDISEESKNNGNENDIEQELESQIIDDNLSQDWKIEEDEVIDNVRLDLQNVIVDVEVNHNSNTNELDEMDDLPGMVNTHLNID